MAKTIKSSKSMTPSEVSLSSGPAISQDGFQLESEEVEPFVIAKIIRSSKSTQPSGGPPPALPKSPGIRAKEVVKNKIKRQIES